MHDWRLLQKAIEVALIAMFLTGCIVPMKSTSTPSTAVDTVQPLANTPAPELLPATATPPPAATATPSYDGEWKGTTSQEKEIAFTILDNGITAMSVDFSFDFTACGVSSISGPTSFWQQSPKASIMEDAFSVAVSERTTVTGLLSSATAATGSLIVTVNELGCKGANEATWTADKLISAAPKSSVTTTIQTPTGGMLQGTFIGVKGQKPIGSVAIILCLVISEMKCVLKADLVTNADEEGSFDLADIPSASYVVLHSLAAKARSSYKGVDGAEVGLEVGAPGIVFAQGFISMMKGSDMVSTVSKDGSLVLNMQNNQPITVDIQLGKITQLELNGETAQIKLIHLPGSD